MIVDTNGETKKMKAKKVVKKKVMKMDAEDRADLKKGIKVTPAEERTEKKAAHKDVLGMLARHAPTSPSPFPFKK